MFALAFLRTLESSSEAGSVTLPGISAEIHLFAWAAELLLHRAFEPASEVFTKGRRLYPQSVRMMLGLGAAKYAQGLKEEAGKIFIEASDLDPADPTPYLFLGRAAGTRT